MRIFVAAFLVVLWSLPAFASGEKRILFLDGARIELEIAARKGLVEVPLPAAMLPNSFRVKPLGSSTVRWVEFRPASAVGKNSAQRTALEGRREVLLDRVKSLDEREGIFKAAAKSQSSRALRKTKSNPDPLGSLRTGTRYALTQLDEVSAARRQTRKALAEVETQIARLDKQGSPQNVARLWLSEPDGKVRIAYLVSNLKWRPWYDFRLSGNGYAEILLCAKLSPAVRSISTSVVPLSLAESFGNTIAPHPVSSDIATIATFRLPLSKEEVIKGAAPYLSLVFSNPASLDLPSGEANGYWMGEYFGTVTFGGCLAGKSMPLVFGKQ
ncbi:MAG: hypothetical protein EHM79_10780 [Geobacter sp.]|nr:MAG: hypothetical protein EHM79_10780 [Geobacter sp.]